MSTTPQVPDTLFSDGEVNTPTVPHAGDTLFSDEEIHTPSQQATAQGFSNPSNVPNARIRNMTVDPTKDINSPGQALLSGVKTGAELAAIPASAIGLGEAAPVIAHLAEHLPTLDKAYKVLKAVSGITGGVGGTIYTLQHLKDVL